MLLYPDCRHGASIIFHCPHTHSPTVRDAGVTYVGTDSNGVESFLNIRYGHDTSGQRRFKPPIPFHYATGTRVNTTEAGAACPQILGNPFPQFNGVYNEVTLISEDCLAVRVTRPSNTYSHAKLPVMVYLYGLGYEAGSIYGAAAYDPSTFVRQDGLKGLPVIYVAINYRVGIFVFAASDSLRDEDSLNAGLLDQYLGLHVTLFGHDVGWANVQLQLTAYGGNAEPLFNRAILQSGPTFSGITLTTGVADNSTTQVAQALNCTSRSGNGHEDTISCLRALPMTVLNNAANEYANATFPIEGYGVFRPTAPSTFIPDAPHALLHNGSFRRDVDILVGWNENDGSVYIPQTVNSTAEFTSIVTAYFPGLSSSNLQELAELYPASNFSDDPAENIERNFFRAARVIRDAHFVCPALRLGHEWNRFAANQSVYMYALNQTVMREEYANAHHGFTGVNHLSDIPYVFDTVNGPEWSPTAKQSDYDMASRMSGSWASFARHGQPTVPSLSDEEIVAKNMTIPGWTQAGWIQEDGRGLHMRVLGGPRDGMTWTFGDYDEYLSPRCVFWGTEDVVVQTNV
ncbi:carboxylesterase family protein [Jackrogersella minutella]|nr:carboxylesterase family protein [Jackrogersella minutella]